MGVVELLGVVSEVYWPVHGCDVRRRMPRAWCHAVQQSQGQPPRHHDNAAKESFFASLEKERLRRRTYATHEQARSSIFQYIEEFYNRRRLHSTLGYRSPDEIERDHHLTLVVAEAV